MSALEKENGARRAHHGRAAQRLDAEPKSRRCSSCRSTISCTRRNGCIGRTSIRTPCRSRRCCRSRRAPAPRIAPIARRAFVSRRPSITHDLMPLEAVRAAAQRAKDAGATRFCMGASYRGPKDSQLEPIVEMVKAVKAVGLETCATLGLAAAGPGRAPRRSRPRLLQPQLGFVGRVLREDHQHAHLCGSARDARARARGRRQGLLRRHRRHGRDARRPRRLAAHARDAGAAARKRADQRARADPRHAARRPPRRSTRSSSCAASPSRGS